jgi:hypothetical protein
MSLPINEPVQLLRVCDRQPVEAWLKSVTQKHLDDFEQIWKPMLRSSSAIDQYWDWEMKSRTYGARPGAEQYAVECDDITQGLMLIETLGHRSWFEESRRVIYVRSLATAPWNRLLFRNPLGYRLVGTTLLEFARYRSRELGYGGLVGLHALPEAEEFYRASGMIECGADVQAGNLIYFEYYRRTSDFCETEDLRSWDVTSPDPPEED